MTVDQRLEGRIGSGPSALGELLEQLPVCQPDERPRVKQGAQVSQAGPVTFIDHESVPDAQDQHSPVKLKATKGRFVPRFS